MTNFLIVASQSNTDDLLSQIVQMLQNLSANLDKTTSELLIEAFLQVGLAFIGALLAFLFALWLERRQRVAASTESLINEFSSREMLKSRFVTVGIADKIACGEITLESVASSSLQGAPKGFVGEDIDGLTEHQHMSNLIGYYRRLALSLLHRWVSQDHIERSIGGSLHWTLPFLMELADEAELLTKKYPTDRPLVERAAWIYSIRYVASRIDSRKFQMYPIPKMDYALTHRKEIRPVASPKKRRKKG